MLFNSYAFLLFFLPAALAGFWMVGRWAGPRAALTFLIAASLFFYGWWNPAWLWVILLSISVNYSLGLAINRLPPEAPARHWLFGAGIAANLAYLGYFKYINFLIASFAGLTGVDLGRFEVVLPLAISFFTFQQISYLTGVHRRQIAPPSLLEYANAVTFFPHLIAGPIVEYRDILRQFRVTRIFRPQAVNLAAGVTLLVIGMAKKVGVADSVAPFADKVFNAAAAGWTVTLVDAWVGAFAFTMQIYFDFSGYSDMALGLACMLGIRLPINFNSPYKATDISRFWRRWHITLSLFLRDHLYIPLGGNRSGRVRRMINLIVTMLLGGLWHGANWTFVLWGGLHGLYLVIHHLWAAKFGTPRPGPFRRWAGRMLTFAAVMVAWVAFRAESFDAAVNVWRGLAGLNGFVYLHDMAAFHPGLAQKLEALGGRAGATILLDSYSSLATRIVLLLAVIWLLPNSVELCRRARPALAAPGALAVRLPRLIAWRPSLAWSLAAAAAAAFCMVRLAQPSQFVYFQF